MSDTISRQAAIDELDKGAWGVEWDKTLAKAMIESLPSEDVVPMERYKSMENTCVKLQKALADAAPVRHGRWIDTDRYGFPVMECSECGAQTGTLNFPYCFNCGARMDAKK